MWSERLRKQLLGGFLFFPFYDSKPFWLTITKIQGYMKHIHIPVNSKMFLELSPPVPLGYRVHNMG